MHVNTLRRLIGFIVIGIAASSARGDDLPRVLLIGDSISMGYHQFVVEALTGEAEVMRPRENCAGTTKGIRKIDEWLAIDGGEFDVIHFNFGLHDLKRVKADGSNSNDPADSRQAEIDAYEQKLRAIRNTLEATGAQVVFATTTPFPVGVRPHRDPSDAVLYNAVATALMRERSIDINDLHAFALPRLDDLQKPVNVHFHDEGSRALAGEVVRHVRAALKKARPLPGSLRHARVAIDPTTVDGPLIYLSHPKSDDEVAALEAAAPNVRILAGLSPEEALAIADQVHAVEGTYCTDELLRAAPNLRWVQSTSSGVERYITVSALMENDDIVLSNMQGVHGSTIADHAIGMLLTLTRDLAYHSDPASRNQWRRSGSGRPVVSLEGRTLTVVGLGGIGRNVARRADGFGMRVLATRRSQTPPPHFIDEQGTPGDLDRFLAESDVVVLCVPLTDETTGMIGARELALMPKGSYLVNVSRGKVVDTDALVDALESGHLAGAALDVTDPEPLPPDHVLWSMPNVVITPHLSGRSALTSAQWRRLYVENLRRFGAGEPLLNVVDKTAGY